MKNNTEIIKLMADYECFPLWRIDVNTVENLNPDDLPISQELKDLIYKWRQEFDATLDRSDPVNSGFKSDIAMQNFERDGQRIWNQLSQELSDSYTIKYFSIMDGNLHG